GNCELNPVRRLGMTSVRRDHMRKRLRGGPFYICGGTAAAWEALVLENLDVESIIKSVATSCTYNGVWIDRSSGSELCFPTDARNCPKGCVISFPLPKHNLPECTRLTKVEVLVTLRTPSAPTLLLLSATHCSRPCISFTPLSPALMKNHSIA
ncbi:unnamed protein product, partial [Choristocarpus tenellus]